MRATSPSRLQQPDASLLRRAPAMLALALALVALSVAPALAGPPTDLTVAAPPGNDGLNLALTWTAATEPTVAAYAVLRADGDADEWKVLTLSLPPGATSHSDKVVSDLWSERPKSSYQYRVVALPKVFEFDETVDAAARLEAVLSSGSASSAVTGAPQGTWFRTGFRTGTPGPFLMLLIILAVGVMMMRFAKQAREGHPFEIRRIPGIDAIEEGIGRATEMGKPILYVPGIDELQDIQTIASMLILGQISKKVAEYQSDIIVSCCIPIVREVADEVVRAGYYQAGFPDAYNPANTRFISSEQFAFCAGTNGIMLREKPATNIYLGRFFAESLILAETGFVNKSIQIAGTAEATQLPFFIAACDYTLIGEELFAVSAYLSGDPRLVSSLRATDVVKVFCLACLILGAVFATLGSDLFINLFTMTGG